MKLAPTVAPSSIGLTVVSDSILPETKTTGHVRCPVTCQENKLPGQVCEFTPRHTVMKIMSTSACQVTLLKQELGKAQRTLTKKKQSTVPHGTRFAQPAWKRNERLTQRQGFVESANRWHAPHLLAGRRRTWARRCV